MVLDITQFNDGLEIMLHFKQKYTDYIVKWPFMWPFMVILYTIYTFASKQKCI